MAPGWEAGRLQTDVRNTRCGLFRELMTLVLDMMSLRSQRNVHLSEDACSANGKKQGSAAEK